MNGLVETLDLLRLDRVVVWMAIRLIRGACSDVITDPHKSERREGFKNLYVRSPGLR